MKWSLVFGMLGVSLMTLVSILRLTIMKSKNDNDKTYWYILIIGIVSMLSLLSTLIK